MNAKLRITAKGQITLPQNVLEHLGVAPGETVEVELASSGLAQVRAAKLSGTIDDFIGCLKRRSTKPVPIKRIRKIASRGWAGRR